MQKFTVVKLNDKGRAYFSTWAFVFYYFKSVLAVE